MTSSRGLGGGTIQGKLRGAMILECPHCHMTVLAREGECPSCRRRVDDLSGTDPTRTALRIRVGAPLPPHCALCDAASTRLAMVRRVARRRMPLEARLFLGTIVLIFGIAPLALLIAKGAFPGILALPFLFLVLGLMSGVLWPFLVAVAALGVVAFTSRSRGLPAQVRDRRPVRVFVPLCDRCRRRDLEPLAVDTESHAMTFLVDRGFAARVAKMA